MLLQYILLLFLCLCRGSTDDHQILIRAINTSLKRQLNKMACLELITTGILTPCAGKLWSMPYPWKSWLLFQRGFASSFRVPFLKNHLTVPEGWKGLKDWQKAKSPPPLVIRRGRVVLWLKGTMAWSDWQRPVVDFSPLPVDYIDGVVMVRLKLTIWFKAHQASW